MSLPFGPNLGSVPIVAGKPNDGDNTTTQYGPSRWDFSPTPDLGFVDVLDSEGDFRVLANENLIASITDNENDAKHQSGVFRVQGPATTVFEPRSPLDSGAWSQSLERGGLDGMDLTFASRWCPSRRPARCSASASLGSGWLSAGASAEGRHSPFRARRPVHELACSVRRPSRREFGHPDV